MKAKQLDKHLNDVAFAVVLAEKLADTIDSMSLAEVRKFTKHCLARSESVVSGSDIVVFEGLAAMLGLLAHINSEDND